jgi:hypothetical protein
MVNVKLRRRRLKIPLAAIMTHSPAQGDFVLGAASLPLRCPPRSSPIFSRRDAAPTRAFSVTHPLGGL